MKKILTIFFFFLSTGKIFSQCQGNYWLLGDSVSLQFDCSTNQATTGEFPIWHDAENFSCIADSNGNLLLYLNGPKTDSGDIYQVFDNYCSIYNFNGQKIENGDSINTDMSVTNGSIILPYPNHHNQYVIFYIQNNQFQGLNNGLSYSIIDMNQNGGSGSIVLKNQYLLNGQFLSEKVSAVKHGNGRDWWIISHDIGNTFYEYLLTPTSILGPYTFNLNPFFSADSTIHSISGGEITFNNSGNKIAMVVFPYINGIITFYFDRCNGNISSPFHYGAGTEPMYGCSFSADGSKIYSSSFPKIFQFSVGDTTINNVIWTDTCSYCFFGQLQLGPDKKIYVTSSYFNLYYFGPELEDSSNLNLSVINKPDSIGIGCDFSYLSIPLNGHKSRAGLPNLPNYNLSALDESECDSLGLGLNENNLSVKSILNIYPNPASDELTIEILNGVKPKEIEITDALGVTVMKLKQTKPNQQVNIKSLAAGVYFIKVQMQNGDMQVKKFTKE
ncbi:MAG: T9SS type A sorting domain-containing protein [Bacteroidota bacterium]